jgi:hypothetical protein
MAVFDMFPYLGMRIDVDTELRVAQQPAEHLGLASSDSPQQQLVYRHRRAPFL